MKQLRVHGVPLNVYDEGTGQPIVFLHGFPLDHTMWHDQLQTLGRTHRVIAPDLRGFGQSGVTAGTVTMEQFADDVNGLLDELGVGEPVCVCGLSMGGYIAWDFVRKYGPRLHSLVLCDTRAGADTADAAAGRRETADKVLQQGVHVLADTMLPKLFSAASAENRPELVEAVRSTVLHTAPEGAAAALRGMAERADATELLPAISVPALVVVGRDDILSTVDEMRGMAAAIPDARFVEVPDAGHMAPMEAPHTVNAVIQEFLQQ